MHKFTSWIDSLNPKLKRKSSKNSNHGQNDSNGKKKQIFSRCKNTKKTNKCAEWVQNQNQISSNRDEWDFIENQSDLTVSALKTSATRFQNPVSCLNPQETTIFSQFV